MFTFQDVELDQQTEPALLYEKHFGNLQNSELPNQYALEVIPTEDQAREKQEEDEMFAAESNQYQTFEAVPPSGESQWPQVPNFFPQPENPDMLLLPQPVGMCLIIVHTVNPLNLQFLGSGIFIELEIENCDSSRQRNFFKFLHSVVPKFSNSVISPFFWSQNAG